MREALPHSKAYLIDSPVTRKSSSWIPVYRAPRLCCISVVGFGLHLQRPRFEPKRSNIPYSYPSSKLTRLQKTYSSRFTIARRRYEEMPVLLLLSWTSRVNPRGNRGSPLPEVPLPWFTRCGPAAFFGRNPKSSMDSNKDLSHVARVPTCCRDSRFSTAGFDQLPLVVFEDRTEKRGSSLCVLLTIAAAACMNHY